MYSPTSPDFLSWLSLIQARLYTFQEAPSRATQRALLADLEGYLGAVSEGMCAPATLPKAPAEASSPAEWWRCQLQEAVTMFRVSPSRARLENVEAVCRGYLDRMTAKK